MNSVEAVVDAAARNAIPGVLAEYLIKVVGEKTSICGIRLVSGKLGAGEVQDIVLEALDGKTVIRVFGFHPVNFHLKVERDAGKIALLAAV